MAYDTNDDPAEHDCAWFEEEVQRLRSENASLRHALEQIRAHAEVSKPNEYALGEIRAELARLREPLTEERRAELLEGISAAFVGGPDHYMAKPSARERILDYLLRELPRAPAGEVEWPTKEEVERGAIAVSDAYQEFERKREFVNRFTMRAVPWEGVPETSDETVIGRDACRFVARAALIAAGRPPVAVGRERRPSEEPEARTDRAPMEHDLKTHRKPFKALRDGRKRFEYRKNDRNFFVGDTLCLREWDESELLYTHESMRFRVSYIVRGPKFGVPEGYCVMSLDDVSPSEGAHSPNTAPSAPSRPLETGGVVLGYDLSTDNQDVLDSIFGTRVEALAGAVADREDARRRWSHEATVYRIVAIPDTRARVVLESVDEGGGE